MAPVISADDAWANPATRKFYIRLVIALSFGTALEFYDFAVYSQLGKYIGPNFFPAGNTYAEQLSFWAAYAVAFVVRPIGALCFGHAGDRHSRKTSLVFSLLLMAVPTTLMGCLPTFSMISWAAPVLLVLLRLLQGLAIGGENGTALVYLYEVAPTSRRCLVVALGWSGVPFGIFLGMAVVMVLQAACSPAQMMLWGWRVAFLLGALTGIVGVFLRRKMPDPAVFLQCKTELEQQLEAQQASAGPAASKGPAAATTENASARSGVSLGSKDAAVTIEEGGLPRRRVRYAPVRDMLRNHWMSVLLQFLWEFWFAAGFYCYTSFMPPFLAANAGMSRTLALGSTLINLVAVMAISWLSGYCCDRGMPRMIASGVVFILAGGMLAPAAIITRIGGIAGAWLMHLFFLLLVGWLGGLLAVSMCPMYPPEVRATGMNFAHQLAVDPIGGITPVILLAAIKSINGDVFFTLVPWLATCAGVSLITSVVMFYVRPQSNRDV